ncbi:MAG TPA: tetratricopeptide repeat protein, partial [Agriterribacter sp.]|nr:tetratricopeptide repeat protein [Agriterribacter sp.]
MRHLLFILLFALCCMAAGGQHAAGDYERAKTAFQQHKIDSSLHYINSATRYFSRIRHFDSLALTLALEIQVVWEKETLAAAITKADSAMQSVLSQLPVKSNGSIALNSIKGSLYASKFRFDSATVYYNRALHAADTLHPRLPLVILYMNLCRMEMLKEHIEKADQYYNKAYSALQSVNPNDEITLTDLLITKTQYLIVGGRYNRALETALEVEPLLKKHYQEDNPKLAKNYGNLSSVCYYLSRYEEALQYRHKALNVYLKSDIKNVNHNASFYVTYYNMGQLYYYLHEHSLATNYLQKALHIGANVYGRESLGMVNVLVQFGSTQQKLKKHDLAKAYFEEAYHIQKELGPNDYWTLAYIESFYGDVFADQKKYDSAAYYYNASIAHYRAVNEELSYYALFTRMGLASVYTETGNTAMALRIQKDVLKKFRRNFPLLKQPVVEFFNDISATYLKAQQPDSAKLYSDSSILFQTGLKSLPGDPASWLLKLPFSFKVSEQVSIRVDICYEMYRQLNQKRYLQEIVKTIEAYANHISTNMYKLRTQHSLVEQSEVNKAIFSAGIDACWELSNLENKQYYAEKAFMLAEQGKALLLRLASNSFMIDEAMGTGDPVVKRDIELRKRISGLNEQYLNAESD